MQSAEMKILIENGLSNAQVLVEGADQHFAVTIISDAFTGKKQVQRQQLVYQLLGAQFSQGKIHALSMKTYTPDEWKEVHG